jgi:hypothetical protein
MKCVDHQQFMTHLKMQKESKKHIDIIQENNHHNIISIQYMT